MPVIKTYLSQWGQGMTESLSEKEKDTLITLLTKMTGQNKR